MIERTSVILSTYNQPRALELVLWGYAVQTERTSEIVIADDGSGDETAQVVERMRRETGMPIVHVWHADRGFRKTEILNRALLAARSDYLIFSDGDCIPRSDLVATHRRLARPRAFLSGGYLKLSAEVTAAIAVDDVRSGRVAQPGWLREQGWRPGRHALRLLPPGRRAALLDRLTPTRPSWNGHNASTWRDHLIAANGFDLDMAYGGEDRALGERLENAGIRGVQIRYRAPCLHLDHSRPYVDREAAARNREIRNRIARKRETRARLGISELPVSED
jgi:glycosyltransferase involved in cell wall biosynthesis